MEKSNGKEIEQDRKSEEYITNRPILYIGFH